MRLEFAFFKSKVTKRILILFVLAAIIPISVTGFVSYNFVINLLTEQKQKQLFTESKSYGMSIFDRILVAESQLIGLSEALLYTNSINNDLDAAYQNIDASNTQLFRNIKVYSDKFNYNYDHIDMKHMKDGKTLLRVLHIDGKNIIVFNRILNTHDSTFLLSAEVDSSYIFGDMDIFAGDDDACVITKNKGVLNCSNKKLYKLSLPSFTKYRDSQGNTNNITIDNTEHIIASWELFLSGSYNADSWIIYYTLPKGAIFAPIKSFGGILLPILVLSILIVSLISVNQISKILVPLEKLNLLTKKIAKRDFSQTLEFDTNDEFQNLGESFNLMSAELSRQFTMMTAMSNLDRTILTTMDKKNVAKTILNNLNIYLEYDYASIAVLNNKISHGELFWVSNSDNQLLVTNLIQINKNDIDILTDNSSSYVQTINKENIQSISWLREIDSNYITSIAIKQNQEILAFIIIGHQYNSRLNEEALSQLSNYTDRVKVAFNAIEREERLVKQANYDSLTGLPNRELLIEEFNSMKSKNKKLKIAVLFIDLDRFKVINDSQGHAIGDKLLIEASKRIQLCIQDKGILARYGGDEFVVLLTINNDSSHVTRIAEQIIDSISRIFTIDNYEQFIGASIGISVYPKDGDNWDDVLQKSDIAMYKAKESGRGKYSLFSDAMQEEIQEKALLEADLFHAIGNNELYMVYQTQIEIESGNISGAESLIRWKHNKVGNIPPDQFITYAEENGFIVPLGTWALREVIKQCKQWQFEHKPLPKVAINISARQLKHDNFIPDIENIIHNFDIEKTALEFEITESLLLSDDQSVLNKLYRLNKLGISISIDDFGKGYSSLSYLKRLPVQTLKIDRLFIKDIAEDTESKSIVRAIIAMAKSLNKTVIAEGIETIEQLNILKELNCDMAQGYFISKPKIAEKVHDYSKTAIISLEKYQSHVQNS